MGKPVSERELSVAAAPKNNRGFVYMAPGVLEAHSPPAPHLASGHPPLPSYPRAGPKQ